MHLHSLFVQNAFYTCQSCQSGCSLPALGLTANPQLSPLGWGWGCSTGIPGSHCWSCNRPHSAWRRDFSFWMNVQLIQTKYVVKALTNCNVFACFVFFFSWLLRTSVLFFHELLIIQFCLYQLVLQYRQKYFVRWHRYGSFNAKCLLCLLCAPPCTTWCCLRCEERRAGHLLVVTLLYQDSG